MPYEKSGGTTDDCSFEVLYMKGRSGYNPNAGVFSNGFELISTQKTGSVEFDKFVIGEEANRILWLFNTTASSTTPGAALTDASYYSGGTTSGTYDHLPGVVTMSFWQADGATKIGEVTHSRTEGWDRVGGGTAQQGYISSPPPLIKFTVSASHNMGGVLKVVNSAVGDYGDKTKNPII